MIRLRLAESLRNAIDHQKADQLARLVREGRVIRPHQLAAALGLESWELAAEVILFLHSTLGAPLVVLVFHRNRHSGDVIANISLEEFLGRRNNPVICETCERPLDESELLFDYSIGPLKEDVTFD